MLTCTKYFGFKLKNLKQTNGIHSITRPNQINTPNNFLWVEPSNTGPKKEITAGRERHFRRFRLPRRLFPVRKQRRRTAAELRSEELGG